MSHTEIFGFRKSGYAFHMGDTHNSHRGAMQVWEEMEKKYLPPAPPPRWWVEGDRPYLRCNDICSTDALKPIWKLFEDDRVSRQDRIVLGSTFDNVVVMKDDIRELCNAFFNFQGNTSLKEQAAIIENYPVDVIAIGWNQTSVNCDTWTSPKYNILKESRHWNLFETIPQETDNSLMSKLARGGY